MSPPVRLGRAFFARDAETVGRQLVGKLLVAHDVGGTDLVARLVETEAYTADDPAAHSYAGLTPRTATMFGLPGHLYVYFSYGMHWCANVVSGPAGAGEAVLLRAAEPLAGHGVFRDRRRGVADRDLLRGPARLAQAFGLDRSANGADLCAPDAVVHLADDGTRPDVEVTARIGITKAADLPRRYVAAGSRWASAYRGHRRAPG
jgi:DNA-3-methyladenine glycosylase